MVRAAPAAARHLPVHRDDECGAEPTAAKGQAGCTHRGNDENRKKPVRWKRFAPWFRNASCPSRTCSLPAAPRRRASWPCPDSTPSPRDGCSPDRPRQAAELDQRQERQAIPDRKGQKLGGVQPIHQARRCAPSLGGASSPRGACAPGAFSLEIDPTELDRELGGLEVSQRAACPLVCGDDSH